MTNSRVIAALTARLDPTDCPNLYTAEARAVEAVQALLPRPKDTVIVARVAEPATFMKDDPVLVANPADVAPQLSQENNSRQGMLITMKQNQL